MFFEAISWVVFKLSTISYDWNVEALGRFLSLGMVLTSNGRFIFCPKTMLKGRKYVDSVERELRKAMRIPGFF